MLRTSWSVAVFTTVLVSGAASSMSLGACAPIEPGETEPTIDPAMPQVDASYDPTPATNAPGASDAGADAAKKDAGKSTPDSGPTPPGDAGPTIPKPAAGEVLITEVMYNPFGPEPAAEWFEVYNKASSPRSLSGLTIVDGSARNHVIDSGVVIDSGAYALLVRDKTTAIAQKVPAAAILYAYGSGLPDNAGVILLNGTTGKVSLFDGTTEITTSAFGGWYSQSGGSTVQLKVLDAGAGTQKSSWCLSLTPWTTGSDKGTPGAASDCP